MSGLSLMQVRSFIDRLGDLDEEVSKICRASEHIAKAAGKDHGSGVDRLKDACDALKDKQKYIREAKEHLLGLDGFIHAESGMMRDALANPRVSGFFGDLGKRVAMGLEGHVAALSSEIKDGTLRVTSAIKALRDAQEDMKNNGRVKESAKALEKLCASAEKAIDKAVKMAANPPKPKAPKPEVEELSEGVEKEAGYHGYNLTGSVEESGSVDLGVVGDLCVTGEQPKGVVFQITGGENPEKLAAALQGLLERLSTENKVADSKVPGNESKGPKELDEEDMGWVPGHRTTKAPKDKKEANDHGYNLTAGLPPEFLENAKKKKDEASSKKEEDEAEDSKAKKANDHGYDLNA